MLFHTRRPASKLARFGRSRQKRNDCPLVTLALATDEGGFPRRSSVLPGNVSEPGTLLDALDSLATEDEGEDKPTVIMDAGIATEDNLAALRERGFHWITVKRGGFKQGPFESPLFFGIFIWELHAKVRKWRAELGKCRAGSGNVWICRQKRHGILHHQRTFIYNHRESRSKHISCALLHVIPLYLVSFFEGQVTVASGHDSTFLHFFASELSSFLGRNASCCDFKRLFPPLAGVALHGGTGDL